MKAADKLTPLQQECLSLIGREWQIAPLATKSATLLSLMERGLIEARINPGVSSWSAMQMQWHSAAYQWRRMPIIDAPTAR